MTARERSVRDFRLHTNTKLIRQSRYVHDLFTLLTTLFFIALSLVKRPTQNKKINGELSVTIPTWI